MKTDRTLNTRKLFVRPEQGAESLGIGKTKFYELLKTGEIPSTTIGRSRVIHVDDLEAFAKTLVSR